MFSIPPLQGTPLINALSPISFPEASSDPFNMSEQRARQQHGHQPKVLLFLAVGKRKSLVHVTEPPGCRGLCVQLFLSPQGCVRRHSPPGCCWGLPWPLLDSSSPNETISPLPHYESALRSIFRDVLGPCAHASAQAETGLNTRSHSL